MRSRPRLSTQNELKHARGLTMQPHARAAVHAAIYIASTKRGAPSNSLIEPNLISFCWLHVHTHLCPIFSRAPIFRCQANVTRFNQIPILNVINSIQGCKKSWTTEARILHTEKKWKKEMRIDPKRALTPSENTRNNGGWESRAFWWGLHNDWCTSNVKNGKRMFSALCLIHSKRTHTTVYVSCRKTTRASMCRCAAAAINVSCC